MNTKTGFKQARIASKHSDFHSQHVGAVTYYKGSLLSIGYNSEKTHPSQKEFNKVRNFDENSYPAKVHAEMMALTKIKNLDIDFSKIKLFVWRGKDEEHMLLSRPCKACEAFIRSLGIKDVYYTGEDKFVHERYI